MTPTSATLLKTLFILFVAVMDFAAVSYGQTPASQTDPKQQVDAQRRAISQKRTQLESGFAAEDAVCYQRFAVNSCLNEVNERRRAAMADLRRQDVLLNDEERKRRGAEQVRRVEEKQLDVKQQEAVARRAKIFSDYQSRAQAAEQKQQQKDADTNAAANQTQAAQNLQQASQRKAQTRQDRSANAPKEAEKFNRRQSEAQERRAKNAEQLRQKGPSTAKGLPIPP